MPKPLSHSSYFLKVKKNWEYWLNYYDELLVEIVKKSDTLSYKPFLNTAF